MQIYSVQYHRKFKLVLCALSYGILLGADFRDKFLSHEDVLKMRLRRNCGNK